MSGWLFEKSIPQCKRKRIIVIATEGEITEPQYFQRLNSMSCTNVFDMVENFGNGSDPRAVLARMKKHLSANPLEEDDDAWIVIDQDRWPQESLRLVEAWAASNTKHHFALSVRRFENWLKLHVAGDEAAEQRFHRFLVGQTKHIPDDFLTKSRVLTAMDKAKLLYRTQNTVGNMFELMESFFLH